MEKNKLNIAVLHKFISDTPLPPWLKDKGMTAKELCENYNYNVFITGDNHKSFVYIHPDTKQIVFNCGTITRQKINEKDYIPIIYLFDSENLNYKTILLDDNKNVVTNVTSSKLQLEREIRISSFVELVETKNGVSFDFISDIKDKLKKEKINQDISNEIFDIIKECEE